METIDQTVMRRSRGPRGGRSLFGSCFCTYWLLAGAAVPISACDGSENGAQVDVRDPGTMQGTPDAATDAGALDGSAAGMGSPDAALDARGPTPEWPDAEQILALPYGGEPVRAALTLAANPQKLDVHFNVDSTGSFGGEIATLQRELSRSVIPALRARVSDTQLGVSRFADFPILPFGSPGQDGIAADVPYELLCPITASVARVSSALTMLSRSLGNGADTPEAGAESLYQVATGAGFTLAKKQLIAPFDRAASAAEGGGTLGGVGFRTRALRVLLHITDAPSHTSAEYAVAGITGVHDLEQAATALQTLGIRVLGINSISNQDARYADVREQLSAIALATGAYTQPVRDQCRTGIDEAKVPSYRDLCPWVFDVAPDGSGLAGNVVDAVVALLNGARFSEVHVETSADPLGFIQRIEVQQVAQDVGVAAPLAADRLPVSAVDGVADSYLDVNRQQRLGFVVVLGNPRIAAGDLEQRFRVSLRLVGDGVELEERLIGIRVPGVSRPPSAAADEDGGSR